MPDAIDHMQDVTERHVENSLTAHARAQASRPPGLAHCEQDDCRTAITPLRRGMGARLCIECAQAEESRGAHLAAWRRR